MALILVFLAGVCNFAMHRAVLESRHPIFVQMNWTINSLSGRLGLVFEFTLLFLAMLLASRGQWGWLSIYFAYFVFNGGVCWMFLTRRI